MFNKEFLKTLTILYVEDDLSARTILAKTLARLFKKVHLAQNGYEGYELYSQLTSSEENIDLILSDINMPKMNGIEMLEKIRETNSEIPLIFTTARSETEFLLKAISLNVEHYALKPIDIEDVIFRIQKVCEKKYYQSIIEEKNSELKQYLNIINNVATIIKLNKDKKITFANENFINNIAYKKEDIINQDFDFFLHKDTDKMLIEDTWKSIDAGETLNDHIKYQDEKGETLYIKSTFFKIKNEKEDEYINIGFISTSDLEEKRDFHKKVLEGMKDKNIEVSSKNNEIEELQNENNKLANILNSFKGEIKQSRQKKLDFDKQIEFYEKELLNIDLKLEKKLILKNNEIEGLIKRENKHKTDSENSSNEIKHYKEELQSTRFEIEKQIGIIAVKEKRVEDLSDILKHRESQLRKLDSSLLDG